MCYSYIENTNSTNRAYDALELEHVVLFVVCSLLWFRSSTSTVAHGIRFLTVVAFVIPTSEDS
jgi:CRISPR-associated DxTHG motif protein